MRVRRKEWLLSAIAFACTLGLVFLVVPAVFDRTVAVWIKLLLLLCGLAVALSTLFANGSFSWPRHWSAALQPRFAMAVLLAAAPTFSLLIDMRSLLDPPPARESKPFALETGQEKIAGDIANLGQEIRNAQAKAADAGIAKRITGDWGEPGCSVIWRIGFHIDAITAEVAKRPSGAPPYAYVGTVLKQTASTLEVRGEEPASARGSASSFHYESNGVTERLTWDDRSRGAPLILERCPAQLGRPR